MTEIKEIQEIQEIKKDNKLVIDGVEFSNPVITAPMAGITDRAYREILHKMGAGLVYTEMLSDKALTFGDHKTISMLNVEGEAAPIGVQLCGSEPEVMAEAAAIIEAKSRETKNIAVIDINMGCPVSKIVKNGEGSRLMTNPKLAESIVRQVVEAVTLPVTVKMRLGWDDETKNVLELAARLEGAGAKAVAIHGRTRQQMYSGKADWTLIGEAASILKVPVIGNGDIDCPETALLRLGEFGCSGIMIGRALIGNPWLVRDTVRLFAGLPKLPPPDIFEVVALGLEHLRRQVELCGEYIAVRHMRSHLPWYIKGRRGAAAMRQQINELTKVEEIEELLWKYARSLAEWEFENNKQE